MSATIDLESLPPELRAQIEELQKPPTPLFPIAPREFEVNFGNKETKEMALKIDLLIRAVNEIHETLTYKTVNMKK